MTTSSSDQRAEPQNTKLTQNVEEEECHLEAKVWSDQERLKVETKKNVFQLATDEGDKKGVGSRALLVMRTAL